MTLFEQELLGELRRHGDAGVTEAWMGALLGYPVGEVRRGMENLREKDCVLEDGRGRWVAREYRAGPVNGPGQLELGL